MACFNHLSILGVLWKWSKQSHWTKVLCSASSSPFWTLDRNRAVGRVALSATSVVADHRADQINLRHLGWSWWWTRCGSLMFFWDFWGMIGFVLFWGKHRGFIIQYTGRVLCKCSLDFWELICYTFGNPGLQCHAAMKKISCVMKIWNSIRILSVLFPGGGDVSQNSDVCSGW